jgi:chromosome segregation ATPase
MTTPFVVQCRPIHHEEGSMRGEPVRQSEVFTAADAIAESGAVPTIERIRRVLGRGSNSTIAPLLRDWREARAQAHPPQSLLEDPPARLGALVKRLAHELGGEARREVEAARSEADQRCAALRRECEEIQALARQAIDEAELRVREHSTENAVLGRFQEELGPRFAALESELQSVGSALGPRLLQELAELARLQRLGQERSARQELSLARLAGELAEYRSLDQARQRELADHARALGASERGRSEALAALRAAQAELAELRAERARADADQREELARLRGRCERVERDLRAEKRACRRLQRVLSQLRTLPPPPAPATA